jgi:hypothetical protein
VKIYTSIDVPQENRLTLPFLSSSSLPRASRSASGGPARIINSRATLHLFTPLRHYCDIISPPHHVYCDASMNDAQPGPSDYSNPDSPRPSDISSGKRSDTHPQNLRFQRRTSERAYYEGSYREGPPTPRMDYSAVNPGSSPWASSPEASRQSFGDANVSREDLPPPAVSHASGGENTERPSSGWEQDQPKQWQPQNEAHAQNQQQDHQADRQRHGETENRRPQSAARYHGAAPHPAQQRQPQYKLQTKITGLERTGKKDAILRFDVYVGNPPLTQLSCPMLTIT